MLEPLQVTANGQKVLLCGLGRVTVELLKNLGEGWQVTLVDKAPEAVERARPLFPNVLGAYTEDASSPVVLERVGIAEHDYVLALTNDDQVNYIICKVARDKGVRHVSTTLHGNDLSEKFQELGVHVIHSSSLLGKIVYHYLQDPRIHVTPMLLGSAAVFEVHAKDHFRVVGKRVRHFSDKNHRLVGVFRKGELLFPKESTAVKSDDTLVILGKPGVFQQVCSLLDCGNPHFPLAYGQNLLLALSGDADEDLNKTLNKAQFLARNTKVKGVRIICPSERCQARVQGLDWPKHFTFSARMSGEPLRQRVHALYKEGNFGLVAIPPPSAAIWDRLTKAPIMDLAHDLECPLLLMRYTIPWERILVPFNGTPRAEQAVGVAVDIARQLGSTVSVVMVEQPEFLSDPEERQTHEAALARLRELAHIHKTPLEEIVRKGNPVKEIVALTGDYDLLVLGSTNREGSFFSPNVGELLAGRSSCSVLILTT